MGGEGVVVGGGEMGGEVGGVGERDVVLFCGVLAGWLRGG